MCYIIYIYNNTGKNILLNLFVSNYSLVDKRVYYAFSDMLQLKIITFLRKKNVFGLFISVALSLEGKMI